MTGKKTYNNCVPVAVLGAAGAMVNKTEQSLISCKLHHDLGL